MSSGGFYNTLDYSGEELKRENARALAQEELILALFKANPDKKLSPSNLHQVFIKKYNLNPPLTSIRRGLTNLTIDEKLIKLPDMVPGLFHLPEHLWMLNNGNIKKEHTYKKGDPSAGDIAGQIIKQTFVQKDLFGE